MMDNYNISHCFLDNALVHHSTMQITFTNSHKFQVLTRLRIAKLSIPRIENPHFMTVAQ
jgi:hypothetical protein